MKEEMTQKKQKILEIFSYLWMQNGFLSTDVRNYKEKKLELYKKAKISYGKTYLKQKQMMSKEYCI